MLSRPHQGPPSWKGTLRPTLGHQQTCQVLQDGWMMCMTTRGSRWPSSPVGEGERRAGDQVCGHFPDTYVSWAGVTTTTQTGPDPAEGDGSLFRPLLLGVSPRDKGLRSQLFLNHNGSQVPALGSSSLRMPCPASPDPTGPITDRGGQEG